MKKSVEVLKALGDDIRLEIVKKIAHDGGQVSSCDIVKSCETFNKLSQTTLSHHFAKLVDAEILIQHKEGTQNRYTLNAALLSQLGINIHKL